MGTINQETLVERKEANHYEKEISSSNIIYGMCNDNDWVW